MYIFANERNQTIHVEKMMLLLVGLLACHYLADFCLTWPALIQSKADARSIRPILLHAGVHAVLMGCCLLVYGVDARLFLILTLLELITHFLIDTIKAHVSVRFPLLADIKQKAYWVLFGLDQLLHQMVVVAIWYAAVS